MMAAFACLLACLVSAVEGFQEQAEAGLMQDSAVNALFPAQQRGSGSGTSGSGMGSGSGSGNSKTNA